MARINLEDYYTAKQAAERLSLNSGRKIDASYPRSLARYGKVSTVEMGNGKLYLKQDIDAYVVSDRPGPKPRGKDRQSRRPPGRPRKQAGSEQQQ